MKAKWIVDKFMFEDARLPKEVFESLGIELYECDYIPIIQEKINVPESFGKSDPVIYYGTINCSKFFKDYFGYFFNKTNFNCDKYFSNMNVPLEYFLNGDSVFTTFKMLKERRDYWYDIIHDNCIFVRPNSGRKSFTGKPILKRDFSLEIEMWEKLYNIENDLLVLISSPKYLKEENRFLIIDNEIGAFSRYRADDKTQYDTNVNGKCIDFVNSIIKDAYHHSWKPEEIYIMDVALTENDEPKIVELNSFSCSGWYAMDEKTVINKVSRFVEELHKNQ